MDSDLLADLPADLESPEQTQDQPVQEQSAATAAPVEEIVEQTFAAPTPPVEESVGTTFAAPTPSGEEKPAPAVEVKPTVVVEDKVASSTSAPSSPSAIADAPRVEVSAATVARMMGIASTSDLRVIEGRIDLLTSKVAAILTKVDRCLSMFSSVPTASDIGRLEVQVAAIKTMMKEILDATGASSDPLKQQADRDLALEQSRKLRDGIKSNSES